MKFRELYTANTHRGDEEEEDCQRPEPPKKTYTSVLSLEGKELGRPQGSVPHVENTYAMFPVSLRVCNIG